jgi:pimeloyl-ACP methyl ester carboxylesterase
MDDRCLMPYRPAVDAVVTLGDGRKLAYCEWGALGGRPVLLFHGAPGSRLHGPDATTTADAGVRLITVDRPGYGSSDFKPGREILDWPADVAELASALGLEDFDVAGTSSGGPYALACAYGLPERVQRVALISSVAPADEPPGVAADADDVARLAEEIAQSAGWLVETPERFFDFPRPEPDARLLTNPAIRDMFAKTLRETVKQGLDPYGWDCALEGHPWGFALEDINAEAWIFHGEQDQLVPPAAAQSLAAALGSSRLRLFPDAGHGLILDHWREILGDFQASSTA